MKTTKQGLKKLASIIDEYLISREDALKEKRFIINLRVKETDYPQQSMCTNSPDKVVEELTDLLNSVNSGISHITIIDNDFIENGSEEAELGQNPINLDEED